MANNTCKPAECKSTRDDLIALVEWRIGEKPYDHRGRTWAQLDRQDWANALDVSEKTITRWTDQPPFVKAIVQLGHGPRTMLLRIGAPDAAKPEEEIARIMSTALNREFRACRKRDEQALAQMDPADPQAVKLAKLLARDQVRSTRRDWGNMCELARQWPPEYAVEAFAYAVTHWAETMTSIKVEAAALGHELTDKRFFRYPMTAIMRKYPEAAFAPWRMMMQEKAADSAKSAA